MNEFGRTGRSDLIAWIERIRAENYHATPCMFPRICAVCRRLPEIRRAGKVEFFDACITDQVMEVNNALLMKMAKEIK